MVLLPILILGQGAATTTLTPLPTTVGPVGPLPELRGAKILSRNGYTIPGFPKVGRVFRYSVHEEFDSFLKRLRSTRLAKDGWNSVRRSPTLVLFENTRPMGDVMLRSFVVQKARIVADPKGRVGIRVIPTAKAPGWTWISYNEHIKVKKP